MKKYTYSTLLIMTFVLLIQWVVDFRFLQLEDLKIMMVLSLCTIILLLLSKEQKYLKSRFRFYLFLTASILSVFILYGQLSTTFRNLEYSFIYSLKPFLFALLLYSPGNSLLDIYLHNHPDIQPWYSTLSRRELEVYQLVLKLLTNKEISDELYIAESTVKKHVQNILRKAGAENRESLINKNNK